MECYRKGVGGCKQLRMGREDSYVLCRVKAKVKETVSASERFSFRLTWVKGSGMRSAELMLAVLEMNSDRPG